MLIVVLYMTGSIISQVKQLYKAVIKVVKHVKMGQLQNVNPALLDLEKHLTQLEHINVMTQIILRDIGTIR